MKCDEHGNHTFVTESEVRQSIIFEVNNCIMMQIKLIGAAYHKGWRGIRQGDIAYSKSIEED